MFLKGLFAKFTWVSTEPSPAQEYGLTLTVVIFSIPLAPTVGVMVSKVGPKWSTSNSKGAIGSIRGTIKSTVAAKGKEHI